MLRYSFFCIDDLSEVERHHAFWIEHRFLDDVGTRPLWLQLEQRQRQGV